MGTQKRIPRSAIAAFCPNAPLIVSGSAQAEEGQRCSLELFSLDFARTGLDLPVVGNPAQLSDPLLSLTWGSFGVQSGRTKLGLVVGALSNGTVSLWDPAAMVSKAGGVQHCVHSWRPFLEGVVNAVALSNLTPNLLAAAGSSGEVSVFDITKPTAPADANGEPTVAVYKPQHPGGVAAEALCVEFNNQNQRIMAIGYSNGHTHVYDFRNKKKFIGIKDDNSGRRTGGLAWSPFRDTHIVLASEDDRSPTIQFWDLRKASSPTLEFVGHSRGVTDVAWCPHDQTVLVSSGKDHRTIVWDVPSGERLAGLDNMEGPARQVGWSPLSPGTFFSAQPTSVALANFTGTASVSEFVQDRATGQQVMHSASKPLPRAPAWMRRKCCARFGFGGKLAVVLPPSGGDASRVVRISAVCLEDSLKLHSEQFESAINGDLRGYCVQKSLEETGEEAQTWSFIQVLFDGDAAKNSLLQKLGFETGLPAPPPSIGEQVDAAAAALQSAAALSPHADAHDDDFFNREAPSTPEEGGFFDSTLGKDGNHTDRENWPGEDQGSIEEDGEAEPEVQRALFVGNHNAAVDVCLRKDRMADALVIAHVSGDAELWRRTLQAYMKACPRPYMRVVEAQLQEDFDSLIKARPVGVWQETLAILVTYTSHDAFTRLCAMLAQRLQSSGMAHAATLCFICAGDVDSAVKLWLRGCTSSSPSISVLQSVLEKSIALGRATSHDKASESLTDLITNYALQLASAGCARTAMTYLELLPGETSPSSAVLKDRIYRSAMEEVSNFAQAPPFPFVLEAVQTSQEGLAAAAAMQAAAYANYSADYGAGYDTSGYGARGGYAQTASYGSYQPEPARTTSYASAAPTGHYPSAATSHYAQQPAATSYAQQPAAPAYSQPAPSYPSAPAPYHAPAAPAAPARTGYAAQPAAYTPAPAAAAPVASYAAADRSPTYSSHAAPKQFQPVAAAAPAAYAAPAAPAYGAAPASATTTHPAAFQPVHTAAPAALPGPMPGMPQPAAPAPLPRAQPPPPPPGPPADCTIYNVNTSAVPAEHQPILQAMIGLFQACEVVSSQGSARKREMDDNAKRLGTLFWKLNEGQLSADVVRALHTMAAALTRGDWATASQVQVQLTGSHWDECAAWLTACKRLIKTRQQLG